MAFITLLLLALRPQNSLGLRPTGTINRLSNLNINHGVISKANTILFSGMALNAVTVMTGRNSVGSDGLVDMSADDDDDYDDDDDDEDDGFEVKFKSQEKNKLGNE
jgi:hypothetical protein